MKTVGLQLYLNFLRFSVFAASGSPVEMHTKIQLEVWMRDLLRIAVSSPKVDNVRRVFVGMSIVYRICRNGRKGLYEEAWGLSFPGLGIIIVYMTRCFL